MNAHEHDKLIQVYKASAGAGKTFTLAAVFIANLINDFDEGDMPHRHQLAITFTKKATTEMKERILQYLYEIVHDMPSSLSFFDEVRSRVHSHITDSQIRARARRALQQIIHAYDRFYVTTIDSFFQSLLCNLAHEVGLSATFRVDLNDTDVLGKGVERMMRNLQPNSELLAWITDYIQEQLENDLSWNVKYQLRNLAQELLKEPYLIYGEALHNLPLNNRVINDFRKTINATKHSCRCRLQEMAQNLNAHIQQDGYSHISRGEIYLKKYLEKLGNWNIKKFSEDTAPSRTLLGWAEDWSKMKKKGAKSQPDAWFEDISTRLSKLFSQLSETEIPYNSCDLSLQRLNPLRLLDVIDNEVRLINQENNAFMLAHTPLIFSKMVGEGEASFVFEKAGTQFRHVMIDEFQDTSALQWKNLKNLLLENISQGNSCMLVGDVKQGIYRFRGGDWTALAALSEDELTCIHHLPSNYRSGKTIVNFNNILYVAAAQTLAVSQDADTLPVVSPENDITALYSTQEVTQAPNKQGGFVRVSLLHNITPKNTKKQEEEDYTPTIEEDLGHQILRLNTEGVPFSEMAILVRYKNEGQHLLQTFKSHPLFAQIPMVSDEAFLLSSSPAVQTLIHALRYIVHRDDDIAAAYLQRNHCEHDKKRWEQLLQEWHHKRFQQLPFYELTEQLIKIFRLHNQAGQLPYLYAFLDAVLIFLDENVADIKTFLQYWDETLKNKSIPSTEVNGIRILTIHKSKGLAFHSVFIPYCHWKSEQDHSNDLLWIHPPIAPYNKLPLLPISMKKITARSIYAPHYFKEHQSQRIENLNLMYVAFTRAQQNLLIWASSPKYPSERTMYNVLFESLYPTNQEAATFRIEGESPTLQEAHEWGNIVEYGTRSKAYLDNVADSNNAKEATTAQNPLKIKPHTEQLKVVARTSRIAFRQSGAAKQFAEALHNPNATEKEILIDVDTAFKQRQTEAIRQGVLLHNIMEQIERVEDVDNAIREFVFEGQFLTPAQQAQTTHLLHKALTHPVASAWFDGSWKLYRECNLLLTDDNGRAIIKRPDRVMMRNDEVIIVDYKFGRTRPSYHEQVRYYAQQLYQMGHTRLRGYLWYIYQNEVEEVSLLGNSDAQA